MFQPIIMAGGTGSRLWPMSREMYPKQFQSLCDNMSMLQITIKRLEGLDYEKPIIITNENHRFIAAEQLCQVNELDHNIILEPVGKNTAPAIALAAFHAIKKQENPILLVLAADHVMTDIAVFQKAVRIATTYAEEGKLVTFGVVPNAPETGYGYIKTGDKCDDNGGLNVDGFFEKPDLETAEAYVSSGNYLWNSGMFAFKAESYLSELHKQCPDIYKFCKEAMEDEIPDLDFIRVSSQVFNNCPEESIDYAVMEKTNDAVVIPLDAGWNDVGSWSSLWDVSPKDEDGNVTYGDVIVHDSRNNFVFAETGLVATVGLNDTVVVQTKDAVLVSHRDQVQEVKRVVNKLKQDKRTEHKLHREVYRPWGKYDSIDNGERYQVKRITVKPGEKLSVQMHHHRAEHWIVVSGTANVTINDADTLLTENESIYIPLGAVHALENPGKIELELIEVQVGSYLGEDDIVRFSDRYGRN